MGSMVIFADLMTNLFANFVFLVVLMLGMVSTEHARQVDLQEHAKSKETVIRHEGESLLVITIPAAGEFLFSGMGLPAERRATSPAEAGRVLGELRPTRVELRIDKQVPSGVSLGLLATCQDLGIIPSVRFEAGKV